MASWTVFTLRRHTSRVSETPNRLNSRAKEINNSKKLRNEDWYSEMRFVRNWTRDSKPVTRDLLGSSRTFDSENKRPTRFNLVFKVSRSVENFFWSGPVAYNLLLFRHGDLRNSMLWSKAPTKKPKTRINWGFLRSNVQCCFFLVAKRLVRVKRIMDNGKSLQSTVQAVWAALVLGGFVGLKMSVQCLFKYWKHTIL